MEALSDIVQDVHVLSSQLANGVETLWSKLLDNLVAESSKLVKVPVLTKLVGVSRTHSHDSLLRRTLAINIELELKRELRSPTLHTPESIQGKESEGHPQGNPVQATRFKRNQRPYDRLNKNWKSSNQDNNNNNRPGTKANECLRCRLRSHWPTSVKLPSTSSTFTNSTEGFRDPCNNRTTIIIRTIKHYHIFQLVHGGHPGLPI
ncbi:hypothetical protein DFS34DRAFT_590005 [Phlyctochytrium arcticum]|nr:hypothetical protein DFS34DRAFT_590005 [Phlyctochytrium arcticum]